MKLCLRLPTSSFYSPLFLVSLFKDGKNIADAHLEEVSGLMSKSPHLELYFTFYIDAVKPTRFDKCNFIVKDSIYIQSYLKSVVTKIVSQIKLIAYISCISCIKKGVHVSNVN